MKPTARLDLAGFLLFANWLWLAKLSRHREDVDVWTFLAIMAVAWLGVLYAWRLAKELEPGKLLSRLWFWAVLFRLAGVWGQPVLENDFYRYLWDGRQFALTGNPYATAPAAHFADPHLPAAFTSVLDGINYPQIPTLYGPVSEAAFALSYWIAPAQVWPLKLLLIAADLLTLWLLLRLAKPSTVLLYAWCPLLIKETAFTAHPDSLGIVFLVAALYAHQRGGSGWVAVLSALAAGAKVFAILLGPFLLWRTRKRHWILFASVLLSCYLPFWLQGSGADLAGLSAFVQSWEFNSSIHGLLAWMVGSSSARVICALLFAGALGVLLFRWRSAGGADLPRGDWIYGLFFFLSATVNAWYLLWLLPFVALLPSLTGVTALAAVTLAYVFGLNLGGAALIGHHAAWVRPLEYGAILTALIADWRRTRRPKTIPVEPTVAAGAPSVCFLDRTLVLIPALNETECVAQTVASWKQFSARLVRVVDNGSTDNTAAIARRAGAEVVTEPRRGYGAAAWRGLQEVPAPIEWILFSSADGSDRLSPEELGHWQRHADQGSDLILGDRCSPTASRQHLKVIQNFGNRLCCLLIALGWGRRFNDMGSLRLIRRAALERLNLRDRGFGWNVEMQVRALERGLRVVELPVGYFPRLAGESKISGHLRGSIRAGWDILQMMATLWWTKDRSSQPAPLPAAQLPGASRAR